jgi:hypothetical protein
MQIDKREVNAKELDDTITCSKNRRYWGMGITSRRLRQVYSSSCARRMISVSFSDMVVSLLSGDV